MKTRMALASQKIGELFAFFYLAISFFIFFALKFKISYSKIIFLQTIFFLSPLILFPFSNQFLFQFLFLVLAIGFAFSNIIYEKIIAKTTKNSTFTSTDIGILHIPQKILQFFTAFTGGFLIEKIGFFSIFLICALSFLFFSIISAKILKTK